MHAPSLTSLEDDLLDLHRIENIISLDCLGQGHDLVRHESITVSFGQSLERTSYGSYSGSDRVKKSKMKNQKIKPKIKIKIKTKQR